MDDFLESNTFVKSKRKVGSFTDTEDSQEDLQQDEKRWTDGGSWFNDF